MEEIQKILAEYDFTETSPVSLLRESADNRVFVVGQKDKKIIRISKRLPIDDITFEYEAISHLSKAGLLVPSWLLTKSGNFYTLINGAVVVVFDFLEGYHIQVDKDNLPTIDQAFSAGRGLGLMSNAAVGFAPTTSRNRNVYSELERALSLSDIIINDFEGGKEFIEQVKLAVAFGRGKNEIEGFIHNDYRPGNVFFKDDNELSGIIDFDWSCNGPIIKDLALAVVEWSFPDGRDEVDFMIFDSFLDGYNSVAQRKLEKGEELYSWIKFSTLSDASTYFCDLATDPDSIKRTIKSYMYRKYRYFSNLLLI